MKTQTGVECWAAILTLTFGTTRAAELSAIRAGRTLPPRKFLGTHFGKHKYSEKNLLHCHLVHHKSHMDWTEIETKPPLREACD
jgi:hypothetical protein